MMCRRCGGKISLRNKRDHMNRLHSDIKECIMTLLYEPINLDYEFKLIEPKQKIKRSSVVLRKPKLRHLVIYEHRHIESGLVYRGSTINSEPYRTKQHIRDAENGSTTKFHRLLRFDGIGAFETRILEDFGTEYTKELEIKLREREVELIREGDCVKNGLNSIEEFEDLKDWIKSPSKKYNENVIIIYTEQYKDGTSSAETRKGQKQDRTKNIDCPKYISRRNGKLFVNIQWYDETKKDNRAYKQKTVKSVEEGKEFLRQLWKNVPKISESKGECPY